MDALTSEKRWTGKFTGVKSLAWLDSEFAVSPFGHSPGYGIELMHWIEKNYRPVYLIGHEPLRNGTFGVEFLKRL